MRELQNEQRESIGGLQGSAELVGGVGINRPLRVTEESELHPRNVDSDSILSLQECGD